MNKIEEQTVYIPISVIDKNYPLDKVCCINDDNMLVGEIKYIADGIIRPIVYVEDEHQEMGNVTHWLKKRGRCIFKEK